MAADDKRQDVLRVRIAWIVTFVWLSCFPVSLAVKDFPITWAQPPMMAVMGWLFARPFIRRGEEGDE